MKNNMLKRFSTFLAFALVFAAIGGGAGILYSQATAEGETTTYDAIYSTSNPVPEIAANTRPSVVQVIISAAKGMLNQRFIVMMPLA